MTAIVVTILAFAGRVCIGLVLLLAAGQKMQSWSFLTSVISNYRLLPRVLVRPAALLLPIIELALGVMLLAGLAAPWSALAAMGLLAIFAGAMAINLSRGRSQIDCGCGESFLRQTLSPVLVARNIVLLLFLVPSLAAAGDLSFESALIGASAGFTFFLLYLATNILVALPKPERAAAV